MQNLWKITIYGYLIIAVVLLFLAFENWNANPQKAYMSIGLAIAAVIMFFFKRRFRRKVLERNNQNKKQ